MSNKLTASVLLTLVACWVGLVPSDAAAQPDRKPRRVILMLADGGGFNAWKATAMYQGTLGKEFHDSSDWVRLAVSTHALRTTREVPVGPEHGLTQIPSLVYDPVRAWDPTRVAGEDRGYPFYFAGYAWLRHASDSANTITALVTGRKTFVGAINVDGSGNPVEETLAALAHREGMRVGTVSSVPLNHATPAAAGGAHNASRSEYCVLAWEMLTSPALDLIAGCGHPDYDNNGRLIDDPARKYHGNVGDAAIWGVLAGRGTIEPGSRVCAGEPSAEEGTNDEEDAVVTATLEDLQSLSGWTLTESKPSIEALTQGPTPDRLLIIPRVGKTGYWDGDPEEQNRTPYDHWIGGTLQQQRGSRADPRFTAPGDDPLIPTVPSLETLTRVALNALDDDPDGFFLHVEGGAVDWAMHANQMGRMIEEMLDFERAVARVIEWVEARDGWDDTLLVITADHDHLLWGPKSDEIPFQPIEDRGPGKLPAYRWLSAGHSNHLVPLFARGRLAHTLQRYAIREDPFHGKYLDQTDVHRVMRSVLAPVSHQP